MTDKNILTEVSTPSKTFRGFNPTKGEWLTTEFTESSPEAVAAAAEKAEAAFLIYRKKTGAERADFLQKIGEEIMNLGDALITLCQEESGLPEARLQGERGRTIGQLNMFAALLREGSWVDATVDTAIPDRKPLPKSDLRRMNIALGPVGIFGASNFPLAFSVAGGDTASALAAGCTVVVKGHPAHPGTSQLMAAAVLRAAQATNMPDGVFSMVHGQSTAVGMDLVEHPLIKAIGFTGSYRGGKALFDAAARRPEPIPVYAEMGSTNPVFILPGALKERGENLAQGLATSVTMGVGQFCTNPGLVVAQQSTEAEKFLNKTTEVFTGLSAGTMLTPTIKQAFDAGIQKLTQTAGVSVLATGISNESACGGTPHLLRTDATTFLATPEIGEEVFGPSTVYISATGKEELMAIANGLHGHLTATLQATPEDLVEYADLVAILERKVGRLLINGFPTGVEVCASMVHGGPFPATTDARTTSVGTAAIYRFSRPVCYQDFPDSVLPAELQNSNPLNIWRNVNGQLTKDKI
ncbi:aldehyde dehydrogenase (NADP(+)) [Adhaeribacter arboris]|uniref:Aldehyde dehydrogenase (NADP(+)) n=1 Tax=Adhaeribacter arboris TaxID=2072846 RepID=A0A2T2YKZ0_9BACT|nr:aldehyde dehydrogenase (NADP(+)) [Adhaeribacter arboris]PSR56135.1 aldehyde dehydrogenase (NADP(+)) [Adhaeribacter arboris]